ncbi:RNA polymerase Rpb5, C-terminal domain-containing protein, partial [Chytriomyces cf. hyalinus JEL632]
HCIVVHNCETVASSAKKALQNGSNRVELFSQEELSVNWMKHASMPQVRVLSEPEKRVFYKKWKDSELPAISCQDPMARYLGLVRRDVVKVVRKSETAGESVAFRVAY